MITKNITVRNQAWLESKRFKYPVCVMTSLQPKPEDFTRDLPGVLFVRAPTSQHYAEWRFTNEIDASLFREWAQ